MHRPAELVGGSGTERRIHSHLRAIYQDACVRIDHFFHDSGNWAGTPIDYLALRVVHEAYPDLTTKDVRLLVCAIERHYKRVRHVRQQAAQYAGAGKR